MLIEIDPSEVKLEAEHFDAAFIVRAVWRNVEAGVTSCQWDDEEKTRLLICDLEVFDEKLVDPARLFHRERRANFRRLGIGHRLLREVIQQSQLMGARELCGKVVEHDHKANPDLLKWYAREGFEILEPLAGDTFPPRQVARIVMRFE